MLAGPGARYPPPCYFRQHPACERRKSGYSPACIQPLVKPMFGLFRKTPANPSPASAQKLKAVRYIGASGCRRFSANRKRSADYSVAAETWLTVVAAVLVGLAALGIWQECRGAKK